MVALHQQFSTHGRTATSLSQDEAKHGPKSGAAVSTLLGRAMPDDVPYSPNIQTSPVIFDSHGCKNGHSSISNQVIQSYHSDILNVTNGRYQTLHQIALDAKVWRSDLMLFKIGLVQDDSKIMTWVAVPLLRIVRWNATCLWPCHRIDMFHPEERFLDHCGPVLVARAPNRDWAPGVKYPILCG